MKKGPAKKKCMVNSDRIRGGYSIGNQQHIPENAEMTAATNPLKQKV
jgi:hypothetical protein